MPPPPSWASDSKAVRLRTNVCFFALPPKADLPPDLRAAPATNSSRTPPSRPRASARSRASACALCGGGRRWRLRWPRGRWLRWSRRQHGDAEGEVSFRCAHVRLFYSNPPRPRFTEKPRLLTTTGLELDSVRPLKSPVSPSAPTRPVAFGSAPTCNGTVLLVIREKSQFRAQHDSLSLSPRS